VPRNVALVFDRIPDMTVEELLDAWTALHDATPPGWVVGRPAYNERRDEWSLYAFDATEGSKVGRRAREWTATAPTQARVIRAMTTCLRELALGKVPR
jgi:hypothetical protein